METERRKGSNSRDERQRGHRDERRHRGHRDERRCRREDDKRGRRSRSPRDVKQNRRSRSPRDVKPERRSRSPRDVKHERRSRSPRDIRHERRSRSPRDIKQERRSRSPRDIRHERRSRSPRSIKQERRSRSPRGFKQERRSRSPKKTKPEEGEEEKQGPNFEVSGKLLEDTNVFNGVVIKYSEPPEARKPPRNRRWRLYVFKGDEVLSILHMHRQSAYLLGKDRKVVDVPIDHPSCSRQHAVFQYRTVGGKVRFSARNLVASPNTTSVTRSGTGNC